MASLIEALLGHFNEQEFLNGYTQFKNSELTQTYLFKSQEKLEWRNSLEGNSIANCISFTKTNSSIQWFPILSSPQESLFTALVGIKPWLKNTKSLKEFEKELMLQLNEKEPFFLTIEQESNHSSKEFQETLTCLTQLACKIHAFEANALFDHLETLCQLNYPSKRMKHLLVIFVNQVCANGKLVSPDMFLAVLFDCKAVIEQIQQAHRLFVEEPIKTLAFYISRIEEFLDYEVAHQQLSRLSTEELNSWFIPVAQHVYDTDFYSHLKAYQNRAEFCIKLLLQKTTLQELSRHTSLLLFKNLDSELQLLLIDFRREQNH
jgi:hypothetical protein